MDTLSEFAADDERLISGRVHEPSVIGVTSNSMDLPPTSTVQPVNLAGERRRSLRPRRAVKQMDTFENEEELDRLLSDKCTLKAYGPTQHWNTGDYITKNWVSTQCFSLQISDPFRCVVLVSNPVGLTRLSSSSSSFRAKQQGKPH